MKQWKSTLASLSYETVKEYSCTRVRVCCLRYHDQNMLLLNHTAAAHPPDNAAKQAPLQAGLVVENAGPQTWIGVIHTGGDTQGGQG